MAEAALRAEMRRTGTMAPVVSVGSARRIGQAVDKRARREGFVRGIDMSSYRVKKLAPHHFRQASHIFVMDPPEPRRCAGLAPADCTAGISLCSTPSTTTRAAKSPIPIAAPKRTSLTHGINVPLLRANCPATPPSVL
jgi:protein-tyrosine-phosphatase